MNKNINVTINPTVREILRQLPDGWRESALEHADPSMLDQHVNENRGVKDIIGDPVILKWGKTREGFEAWRKLYQSLPDDQILPSYPYQFKTVRDQLAKLPDGYRQRALGQADPEMVDEKCDTLITAINCFSNWSKTNEGLDFWNVVTEWVKGKCYLPELPNESESAAKGHNPDGLTESQVGVRDGWRLLAPEEIRYRKPTKDIQMWGCNTFCWLNFGVKGSISKRTYRTQKPEGYFLPPPASDTPVTDILWDHCHVDNTPAPEAIEIWVEKCRDLERQRDKAWSEALKLRKHMEDMDFYQE